jgi:hypothetical protein
MIAATQSVFFMVFTDTATVHIRHDLSSQRATDGIVKRQLQQIDTAVLLCKLGQDPAPVPAAAVLQVSADNWTPLLIKDVSHTAQCAPLQPRRTNTSKTAFYRLYTSIMMPSWHDGMVSQRCRVSLIMFSSLLMHCKLNEDRSCCWREHKPHPAGMHHPAHRFCPGYLHLVPKYTHFYAAATAAAAAQD